MAKDYLYLQYKKCTTSVQCTVCKNMPHPSNAPHQANAPHLTNEPHPSNAPHLANEPYPSNAPYPTNAPHLSNAPHPTNSPPPPKASPLSKAPLLSKASPLSKGPLLSKASLLSQYVLSSTSPCHVHHPVKVLSIHLSSASYSVFSVFSQQVIIYFSAHTVFCFVTIPSVYFSCVYWIYVLLFTVKVWFTVCFCIQTELGSNS